MKTLTKHSEDLPADLPNRPHSTVCISEDILRNRKSIAAGVSKKASMANYCVRIWNEWTSYRQRASGTVGTPIETLSHSELQDWL